MDRLEKLELLLSDFTTMRNEQEPGEIRSAYNGVLDRLNVLISKIHQVSKRNNPLNTPNA